ncbi:hypothetical protein AX774_g5905 [Zancudomyces culisetae]|uniref:Uncharacterized protein n=1 Tax=Zancudomyces culisetae TaxID=1213189 RepID=A0A1R1PI28_ZANCU|nr:hypothetical protein AX774_g5905 [Zancudomyces culisetae]|eukprot:OMH80655.1 hypothetical protein AX774_g5905 [Zancudomyces culisetae]
MPDLTKTQIKSIRWVIEKDIVKDEQHSTPRHVYVIFDENHPALIQLDLIKESLKDYLCFIDFSTERYAKLYFPLDKDVEKYYSQKIVVEGVTLSKIIINSAQILVRFEVLGASNFGLHTILMKIKGITGGSSEIIDVKAEVLDSTQIVLNDKMYILIKAQREQVKAEQIEINGTNLVYRVEFFEV